MLIITVKPKCDDDDDDDDEYAVDITLNEVVHCSSVLLFYAVMLFSDYNACMALNGFLCVDVPLRNN